MFSEPTIQLLQAPDATMMMRHIDTLIAQKRVELGEDPATSKPGDMGLLEVTTLTGAEATIESLPDLRSLNMFGSPQLLVIRLADQMNAATRDYLLDVIKSGGLSTSILLAAEKVRPLTKLSNYIKKLDKNAVIKLELPRDTDGRGWKTLIKDEFNRVGLKANNNAVEAMFEVSGANYSKMVQNAQLLKNGLAGKEKSATITDEDVYTNVASHGSRGAFAITDAVLQRDTKKALMLFRGAVENGDSPFAILGALTYTFKQVIATTTNRSPQETGVNMPPFARKKVLAGRNNFGQGELTTALAHLMEADFAAKAGGMDAVLALERCIIGITTPYMPAPEPNSMYID